MDIRAGPPAPEMLTFTNISVLDLRFFKVFAPVRQAPYIADNFGNIASCPDGGHLPALSAAPGWACGGVYSSGVPFSSGVGISPWRAPSLSSSFFSMRMHRNSV